MKRRVLALVLLVTCASYITADEQESPATEILQRYLDLEDPEPEAGPAFSNEYRRQRLTILDELRELPAEEGLRAIRRALPGVKNPKQRYDLAQVLGLKPFAQAEESAALLCELLRDPDDRVRGRTIDSLRVMARRTDRPGPTRVPTGPDFAPKVEGLAPLLVFAASDREEGNRIKALYALADTRDPLAVLELRRRLKDPSDRVRLYAACFLTEFHDASGLPEMRRGLDRLRNVDPFDARPFPLQGAAMLLASFERITGKSFGPIRAEPLVARAPATKRCEELLDVWAEWWAWQPHTASQ